MDKLLLTTEEDGGQPKDWNRMGRNLIRLIRNGTNGWKKQGHGQRNHERPAGCQGNVLHDRIQKTLAQKLEGGPVRGYKSVSFFLGFILLLHR